MISRREVLIALAAAGLSAPLGAPAQRRPKVARVGLLEPVSRSATGWAALLTGLRELGYVEGKNILIEHRAAEGSYDRLPGLAAELVEMRMDVIVANASRAVRAVQRATAAIPIVMLWTPDPVGSGFAASLAQPGRNITGLASMNLDLSSKYLELLCDAIPKLSRVGVLVNPRTPNHPDYLKRIQTTGKAKNVGLSSVRAGNADEIETVFESLEKDRARALIVLPDSFFGSQARRIAELALQNRLPTMFGNREAVARGGLMSYGQDPAEHYYRAATYIDKILKGAKPGELPIERPTRFELAVNLRTAKALGMTVPQELLLRADKVIE